MKSQPQEKCPDCNHPLAQHRRGLGCTCMSGEPWAQMITCRCKRGEHGR